MKLRKFAARAIELRSKYGLIGLRRAWPYLRQRFRADRDYRRWMALHEPDLAGYRELEPQIDAFKSRPLISIILPVYNVDEKWLRRCVDSVVNQVYPNWELCVADDASTAAHIRPLLEEYAATDKRIKLVFRSENGHISVASNSALELATGEFVALLDHDDELSRDALFWVADEINRFPDLGVIYSDEDLIDEDGRRSEPKFKPDFSRDVFYSSNLITHLSVYRTEHVRAVGGFRLGFEGSQDYDLGLRVLERIDEEQIRHIPKILYHWRAIRGSVAYAMDQKPYAHERARQAIREHFLRTGRIADVVESGFHLHRVNYKLPAPAPRVSVIVSDVLQAVDVGDRARHDFQSVLLDADHEILISKRFAEELNSVAQRATGEVLLFIDDDLRLASAPDSINDMIAMALQPDVGAVSAKILCEDMLVEEAGLVLDRDLSPASAHRGLPRDAGGDTLRNTQPGNFSALSVSCMAISRETFESVVGFDPNFLPLDLFDVDLCLRLREVRKRIVVLPHVEFVREGAPLVRRYTLEALKEFQNRWPKYVERDPFCNPNLRRDGSFRIDI